MQGRKADFYRSCVLIKLHENKKGMDYDLCDYKERRVVHTKREDKKGDIIHFLSVKWICLKQAS